MTATPAQIEILTAALAVVRGVPTRDIIRPAAPWEAPCEAMVKDGLLSCYTQPGGGRHYKVTGAGVRAACPGAKAATYLTGEDVTVFVSDSGRYRMRWDGPGKGRFVQGAVYRVSPKAVKCKEATGPCHGEGKPFLLDARGVGRCPDCGEGFLPSLQRNRETPPHEIKAPPEKQ